MTEPAVHDDPLIAQLRADLDAFVGEPGPAPQLTAASTVTRPTAVTDRRPWLRAGVAAATIAVVVTGLVVLAGRDDPDVADTPLPVATMPAPPTPDGWTVVEWGDIRVSLPPDLDPFAGECTTTPDTDASAVEIDCGGRALTVMSGTVGIGGLDDSNSLRRNGLLTQLTPVPDQPEQRQLLIADVQSLVRFAGFAPGEIDAIVATVGVSSKWRALNEPAPPVPDDWQTVEYQGVTVRVPADWPVAPVAPGLSDPDVCQFVWRIPEGVTLGRGNLDTSTMYCAAPTGLGIPSDGVRLFGAPADGMTPVDTLPALDRVVRGSDGQDVVVRVGFGVDGTIGRTILGSIAGPAGAPPVSPVTGTTAPIDAGAAAPWIRIEYQSKQYEIRVDEIPWPDEPDGWVPVEWGQVRFALPPEFSPFDAGTGCAASTWGQFDDQLRIACGDTTIEAGSVLLLDAPIVGDLHGLPIAHPDADTIASPIYGGLRIAGVDAAIRDRVLSTATVSTGWRAQNTYVGDDVSPWPTPDDWKRVTYGDVEFAVPPAWPVTELPNDAVDPDQCAFVKGDESLPGSIPVEAVLLGRGSVTSDADCDQPALAPLRNGVRAFSTIKSERPSGVSVYDQVDQALAGVSASGIIVRVGIGADQLTSLTILGSLQMSTPAEPPTPTTAGVPPTGQEYETIGTVMDDVTGVHLCFAVLDSLPPQCGSGFALAGFDWDSVDGEQTRGGAGTTPATTWLDDVHVRGVWDESSQSLSITAANVATDADRALQVQILTAMGEAPTAPDYSLPCVAPPGGWQRPATDPTLTSVVEQVATLPGYAGAWVDPATWVLTVRMTGDVTAGEAAVGEVYDGPVCVVEARYDLDQLEAIETELRSLSSVRVMETSISVDASGEWVEGTTILPTPELQASLDDRYGAGVVRLRPYLLPSP